MNPVAFVLALVVLGLVFVVFKQMIENCFDAAGRAGSKGDAVFQVFLGGVLCLVFMGLSFGLLFIGTQPTQFWSGDVTNLSLYRLIFG